MVTPEPGPRGSGGPESWACSIPLTPLREVEAGKAWDLTDPGELLAFTWHLHLN